MGMRYLSFSPFSHLKHFMDISVLRGCDSAFSLLNSMVCLCSTEIAPCGHTPIQKPMPSQSSSATTLALPFISCIAPSAQGDIHFPQPLHFSSSIFTIVLITMDTHCSLMMRTFHQFHACIPYCPFYFLYMRTLWIVIHLHT